LDTSLVAVRFHAIHNSGNTSSRDNRQLIVTLVYSKIGECSASLFLDISVVAVRFHATYNGGNASRLLAIKS